MIQALNHQYAAARFSRLLLSARQARGFVTSSLRETGFDDPALLDRMQLLTSELVTNAVVHAGSDIEVRVEVDDTDVWLKVSDDSPARPNHSPATATKTCGRGLVLVAAVADEWGVADVVGGCGKTVWARISRC